MNTIPLTTKTLIAEMQIIALIDTGHSFEHIEAIMFGHVMTLITGDWHEDWPADENMAYMDKLLVLCMVWYDKTEEEVYSN